MCCIRVRAGFIKELFFAQYAVGGLPGDFFVQKLSF